jgi:hypothetical protein
LPAAAAAAAAGVVLLLELFALLALQYSPTEVTRAAVSWSFWAFYASRDGCTAKSIRSTALKSSKGCAASIGDRGECNRE